MLCKFVLQNVLLLHILLFDFCLINFFSFLCNLVSLLCSNAEYSKQKEQQENKDDDCQNHNHTYYNWEVISPKALDSSSTASFNAASMLAFLVDVAVSLILKLVHHLLHVTSVFRGTVVSVAAVGHAVRIGLAEITSVFIPAELSSRPQYPD